jgi:hypothetical protein
VQEGGVKHVSFLPARLLLPPRLFPPALRAGSYNGHFAGGGRSGPPRDGAGRCACGGPGGPLASAGHTRHAARSSAASHGIVGSLSVRDRDQDPQGLASETRGTKGSPTLCGRPRPWPGAHQRVIRTRQGSKPGEELAADAACPSPSSVVAGDASYCLICLLYSTSAHLRASEICIFWVTTCSNMRASTLIR